MDERPTTEWCRSFVYDELALNPNATVRLPYSVVVHAHHMVGRGRRPAPLHPPVNKAICPGKPAKPGYSGD